MKQGQNVWTSPVAARQPSNYLVTPPPSVLSRNELNISPAGLDHGFCVGDLVDVENRTWPGINKPGGVAKIMKLHDDRTANVSYVLGGSEKKVPLQFIHSTSLHRNEQRVKKERDFFFNYDQDKFFKRAKIGVCDSKDEEKTSLASDDSSSCSSSRLRSCKRRRPRENLSASTVVKRASPTSELDEREWTGDTDVNTSLPEAPTTSKSEEVVTDFSTTPVRISQKDITEHKKKVAKKLVLCMTSPISKIPENSLSPVSHTNAGIKPDETKNTENVSVTQLAVSKDLPGCRDSNHSTSPLPDKIRERTKTIDQHGSKEGIPYDACLPAVQDCDIIEKENESIKINGAQDTQVGVNPETVCETSKVISAQRLKKTVPDKARIVQTEPKVVAQPSKNLENSDSSELSTDALPAKASLKTHRKRAPARLSGANASFYALLEAQNNERRLLKERFSLESKESMNYIVSFSLAREKGGGFLQRLQTPLQNLCNAVCPSWRPAVLRKNVPEEIQNSLVNRSKISKQLGVITKKLIDRQRLEAAELQARQKATIISRNPWVTKEYIRKYSLCPIVSVGTTAKRSGS